MKRVALGAAALVGLLLAGGALAGWLWLSEALSPVDAAQKAERDFIIQQGDSLHSVARRLEADSVIRNALAMRWLARWRGLDAKLQVGEFLVSPALTPEELLTRFAEGQVKTYAVVIPEGFTAREIAARLAAQGLVDEAEFLALAQAADAAERFGVEGPGLEGYLFPETYQLPRGMPLDAVVRTLVDQFLAVWPEIAEEAKAQGFSMREVVTLASIVEKETGVADERPLIAAVFRNRLQRGMRLESDPTIIYGIPDFDGNLRRRDLENADNPYNTYKIPALPPGPIASPGAGSLRAVVRPAESRFLFFVSRGDGSHVFSHTFAEHDANVDRYQRKRRRKR